MSASFAARVVLWQRAFGRHGLPWQGTRDPYRVWLSEIMLQQTQVSTVLGYFEPFLQNFPTVQALAAAPVDQVLALWSGLGYYSRARNLHACAQAVVDRHAGRFPQTVAELTSLPGIGPSTAAAIAAFCFGERTSIFDGNVKRVMARHLGFDADLADAGQARKLWAQADTRLPHRRDAMPAYTQGLMDLGATVCTSRKPNCAACPVSSDCVALAVGRVDELPNKTRRLKRHRRESWLALLRHGRSIWLVRRPDKGVWGGLWCFPVFDDEAALGEFMAGVQAEADPSAPPLRHALTHFDWMLWPVMGRLSRRRKPSADGAWFELDEALRLGLPQPVRQLLQAGEAA